MRSLYPNGSDVEVENKIDCTVILQLLIHTFSHGGTKRCSLHKGVIITRVETYPESSDLPITDLLTMMSEGRKEMSMNILHDA